MEADRDHPHSRHRLYGRRLGPALRARQAGLVETLLPRLRVDRGKLAAPRQLFAPAVGEVWLEIGFGGGEHLAWQAGANPAVGFIGCEAYVNGIAKLLGAIEEQGLDNVRIHDGDAREIVPEIGDRSIRRIFLLFPDPWPKRRHHKRRIVTAELLGEFRRILEPGGLLRFASDSREYVAWTLIHLRAAGGFEWLAETPRDWRERPPDWPGTRYEAKAREQGREPAFLTFKRL